MFTLLDRKGTLKHMPDLTRVEIKNNHLVGLILFHQKPDDQQLQTAKDIGYVLTDNGTVYHLDNTHEGNPIYVLLKDGIDGNNTLEILRIYNMVLNKGQHIGEKHWAMFNAVMDELKSVSDVRVNVDDDTGKRTLCIDYAPKPKEET